MSSTIHKHSHAYLNIFLKYNNTYLIINQNHNTDKITLLQFTTTVSRILFNNAIKTKIHNAAGGK